MENRNNRKISVIVPVYKVEEYLVRCLDSLCRQSMREIEIILVDDGSPDRCGEFCEEYAAKDARFKVIHHSENKGLSEARNTGIANADCDYLMFVDSDDYVHEDFCKIPYECAVRYQADLVMFRSQQVEKKGFFDNRQTGKINYADDGLFNTGYKTRKDAIDLLLTGKGVYWSTWNKLYKKELFDDIKYPTGYLYEDIGTTHKTVLKSQYIYFLNSVWSTTHFFQKLTNINA